MIRLPAHAKINLYLRVLGKRPDGYHELETIFERIDLADELSFESSPSGIQLTCDAPALSCGNDNLIVKAARLLQRVGNTSSGAAIHLTKRIPIAAGLGGGSSDAASTLLGLNELWQMRLPASRLMELAARLGSDVPFFLYQTPYAIGRGRGERCEPVSSSLMLFAVLAVPDAPLSTKEIYEAWDHQKKQESVLTASTASITIVAHALRNGSLRELAQGLANDLAPAAIRRCPVIARIHALLRDLGCLGVCLSGSGPSVFGLCTDEQQAQALAGNLRRHGDPTWRVEVVRAGI